MSLTRKRQKELNRLRGSAQDLWQSQQDVMGRANLVAREAGRQVGHLNREEISPRVRSSYDAHLRPRVDRGVSTTRRAAQYFGDQVTGTLVPAAGAALGTALSVVDVAKDTRVRQAIDRMSPKEIAPKKSGPGAGTFIAIGVGVVALAGIGYAVWQTFRADDELWVANDESGDEAAALDSADA